MKEANRLAEGGRKNMALAINNIIQTRQLGRRPSSIKTITKHNNLVRTMQYILGRYTIRKLEKRKE